MQNAPIPGVCPAKKWQKKPGQAGFYQTLRN
jgi:hypothetical protein